MYLLLVSMRSAKVTVRPPGGTRQGKPSVGLFGRNVHLCNAFYGSIHMARNVQAAPRVNRRLQKQRASHSGCFRVLRWRVAKVRKDKNPYKKYTCTIYKRVPINDEIPIHHTPLLFFLSPPLRSPANSRRHDGDAPCVTSPLTPLSESSSRLSAVKRAKV